MANSKWELAGYCGVDSGQIIMVDPCYVLANEPVEKDPQMSYDELLKITDRTNYDSPNMEVNFSGVGGNGTYISGFGGDGNYPVYVRKAENGLVLEAKIVFNHEEEE